MAREISALLADLMVQCDEDLPLRLEAQDEALRSIKCIDKRVGRWINKFEVPFLLSILSMDNKEFGREYPEIAAFSLAKRQDLATAVQEHCEICPRCQLKIAYDTEWDLRIRKASREHKNLIARAVLD